MNGPQPPRLTQWLARRLLGEQEAEFILGDLAEEFAERANHEGVGPAARAYRRHAARAVFDRLRGAPRRSGGDAARRLGLTVRSLRRSPGFTAATVATLGLGLGGSAAVVSLAESILSPLPFPDSDRLVAVWETRDGAQTSVAPANYLDWRRELGSFSGLAAHLAHSASVTVDGQAFRTRIATVSGNFFEVLGVPMALGSGFDPTLDTRFPDRVAILSTETWSTYFQRDPAVLGRTFLVEDATYTVVGVAPAGVAMPEPGTALWLRSRPEAPELAFLQGDLTQLRDAWYFEVLGRLAPGAELESARAETSALAARLERTYPDSNTGHGTLLVPLLDQTVADFGPVLAALAASVLLLLAAATVNVTHLVMSRRAQRSAETEILVALGARRGDLLGAVALEGLVLGAGGAIAGLVLAVLALEAGVGAFGAMLPRADEVTLRWTSALVVIVAGAVIGAGVSLVAFGATRPGRTRTQGLRDRSAIGGGWRAHGLVAAQVASAVALLASGGLLARSLQHMTRIDLGFDADRVAVVRVAQPDAGLRSYEERIAVYEEVRAEAERVPGVTSATFGGWSPLSMGMQAGLRVEGWDRPEDPGSVSWTPVHAGYFETFGMALVSGRAFASGDDGRGVDVAIVNTALAESVFGADDPVGRVVTIGLDDAHARPITIVGVVEASRTRGPTAAPGPVLYRPIQQTTGFGAESVLIGIRADNVGAIHLGGVRGRIRAIRPGMPVYGEELGVEMAGAFQETQRSLLVVLGVFAVAATLLGAVGVYGVTAHGIRRRRREIGVRMALGADRGRVLMGVLSDGLRRASIGIPIGIGLSVVVSRTLSSLLYGVGLLDVPTLALVCATVLAVTTLALVIPARNAARTDPATATRAE